MTDAAELHIAQIDYWNGPGGRRWISHQARRDRMLAEFGDIAMIWAAAEPGENVVEVGCGCGELSAKLAERVGATGRILAVDVSAPILASAQDRLAIYPFATAVLADAATYRFEPAMADLLFSRFGVMFFGDPTAAFANLRTCLKPTGRVVFACWRAPSENPWMTVPLEAARQHLPPVPKPGPEDPGPFSFASEARVSRILTGAGFGLPSFERVDLVIDVAGGAGLDAAVSNALEIGPTARALEEQPTAVRERVSASVREALAPHTSGETVPLPASIWVVRTAPAIH